MGEQEAASVPSIGKVGSVYSVEEIVAVFHRIDGQLLDLHRCSSDDFLGLNAQFKGFYKEAKGMSTSAGALFLLLSEGANRKLITALEEFYDRITHSEAELMRQLNASIEAVMEMRMTLEGVYIPLRNANQNVGTLRLLLTNLLLGRSANPAHLTGGEPGGKQPNATASMPSSAERMTLLERLVPEVEQHIAQVHKLGKSVGDFSKNLEEVRARLEGVRQESAQGVESVMNAVHHGLKLFAEKQEEAHTRIPEITAKSENCSKSIAGIITNLQYQDIIRQKMEHIQTAHKTLIEDMQRAQGKGGQTEGEYWVRMLVQVRDIAALQSAQLVSTNREYQQAIETIARHFREIAGEMEEIATLCRTSLQVSSEVGGGGSSITLLLNRLQDSWKVLGDLSLSLPRFWRDLERLSERAKEVADLMARVRRSFTDLEAPLHRLVEEAEREGSKDLSNQLTSVLTDLGEFWEVLKQHKEMLQERRLALVSHEDALKGASPLWDEFRRGAERMHSIGSSLAQTEHESTELLGKIEQMSKKVSEDTREAMQSIRYYDFFEKVIGELVSDLNRMSMRIRDSVQDSDILSDMSAVRNLYTMASERKVHDEIMSGGQATMDEGDVDLFGGGVIDDASVAVNEEEDDGLELF